VTKRYLAILGLMALWMIALTIIAGTSVNSLSAPPWGNLIGGPESVSPRVAENTHVGQLFTAQLPGLYRIELTLVPATVTPAHRVTFHLKADPASKDLWTAELPTHDLQADKLYGFEFEPIRDSQGQTFYFYLESPESTPADAIAVGYSPNAILEGASAYLNGQPVAGNLQFHTYYSLRTRDKFDLLLSRMAEGRPYMFGTKGFYIGLAVAYVLVLGMFLLQTAKALLKEEA
jgi:hypothetical protein